eukprot:scaffold7661_cov21-Tisochrysis_lutea.AAC.3
MALDQPGITKTLPPICSLITQHTNMPTHTSIHTWGMALAPACGLGLCPGSPWQVRARAHARVVGHAEAPCRPKGTSMHRPRQQLRHVRA